MADENVRELLEIKDNSASNHNYDLKELVEHMKNKKRSGKHEIVDLRAIQRAAEPTDPQDMQGSCSRHPANNCL